MSDEAGAQGALIGTVVAALGLVPGLSQVADGAPIQAGDACAVVETGPETDWGFKDGVGAELRFAVRVECGGERPDRARLLLERVRAALAVVVVGGRWRLVTLTMMRSRVVRAAGRKWVGVGEYRARMMRE